MPETTISTTIALVPVATIYPDGISVEALGRMLHTLDEIFGERLQTDYATPGQIRFAVKRVFRS